jgi:hypothetical protein
VVVITEVAMDAAIEETSTALSAISVANLDMGLYDASNALTIHTRSMNALMHNAMVWESCQPWVLSPWSRWQSPLWRLSHWPLV